MNRLYTVILIILIIFSSCEEVIKIDLNSADPAFVVEATIFKDSVPLVHLTQTANYFSDSETVNIEDASINITAGALSEGLNYIGNGFYKGNAIIGTEGQDYKIEVHHDGTTYDGVSSMPSMAEINMVHYYKSESQSILNPEMKTVFTIVCEFDDDPDRGNFYLIRFMSDGKMLEDAYYLLTEEDSNQGVMDIVGHTITFSESVFYNGGEVEIQLFSIDESAYRYFFQLNDILFWKHRVMPPTPYNPVSNISNGALGYFAAWAYDSETIMLE